MALSYKYKEMGGGVNQKVATVTVSKLFTCDGEKTFKADFANNSLIAVLHLANNYDVTLERMNEENFGKNFFILWLDWGYESS